MAYVNRIKNWYGDAIATSWGVPGFSPPHIYNHIAMAFWTCSGSLKDMAMVWSDAYSYFSWGNSFGSSTAEIQRNLRKRYNDAGIKIMVSAFGDSEFPTTLGLDPVQCGRKLGQYVLDNNLDGADVDWEDNEAMNKGLGEDWIIKFTLALREVIPEHTMSQGPQAPYFKEEIYVNGAYMTVHKAIGHLVNFYNVNFFNQLDSRYDTYEQLFINASGDPYNGTALMQIVQRGIPAEKIVICKPVNPSDATNTGWMDRSQLGAAITKAYDQFGWFAGVTYWQYFSDSDGDSILSAAGHLKELCATYRNCK